MTSDPRSCTNCGAALSLQDLTQPNCPYCNQIFPHHARAAEHAVLVNQVLGQQIQAQNPWMAGGSIPQIPYQHGANLPPGAVVNPYGDAGAQITRAIHGTTRIIVIATAVGVGLMVVLGMVVAALLLLL